MIKTFTVWTAQVDDEKRAVKEIKDEIDSFGALHVNTVGIIACHYEFVHTGTLKAICDALPFDVVGTTSPNLAVASEMDSLLLTLMIITSDDIEFKKTLTASLLNEPAKAIEDGYRAACNDTKPELVFMYAPFLVQNTGDEYVNVISKASGGVPCFGTLAMDDSMDFSNCFIIDNGQCYKDRMVMLLVYGNIHPKFYIANISDSKIIEKPAVVTKSEGPLIMELNGRPVPEYFEELGLTDASETRYALSSLPFMLDFNDGTPKVSKVFIMLTPEKNAVCAGAIPQNSTLYIASTDKEDVISTTKEVIDLMSDDIANSSGMIIYSCIGRSITLGAKQYEEMELVDSAAGEKLPFMMVRSGGEICPTMVAEGKAVNRFHNNAFVACLF